MRSGGILHASKGQPRAVSDKLINSLQKQLNEDHPLGLQAVDELVRDGARLALGGVQDAPAHFWVKPLARGSSEYDWAARVGTLFFFFFFFNFSNIHP